MKNNEFKNSTNNMKEEVANELGIDLKNSNITAKEAGKVGGKMTQELVNKAKNQMK